MQNLISKKMMQVISVLFVCSFLITLALVRGITLTRLFDALFVAVVLEHVVALAAFVCMAILLFALIVRKEYKSLAYGWKNILLYILFVGIASLLFQDYWYQLANPHPLFNDQYWFL